MSSVQDVNGSLVLAAVDLVQQAHPAADTEGQVVNVGSVGEASGSGVDALGSGVLPHGAQAGVSRVLIRSAIASFNTFGLKSEFGGDQLRPVRDEFVLGGVLHGEDSLQHAVAEVPVLVVEALGGVRDAKVHEVWHQLVHLVGVRVACQREWSK